MIKRYFAGFAGAGILTVSVYFSFNVARWMYYSYFLWPKEKAGEHYITPTRWQDFTFLGVFWTISLLLILVSSVFVRFALSGRRL